MTVAVEEGRRSAKRVHQAGAVCLWAGVLGATSGIYLAFTPTDIDPERFSYPLGAAPFVAIQIWFVLQHVGLIISLLGLAATGAAGTGRPARIGQPAALGGMALLTMTELAAVFAAGDAGTTTLVTWLSVSYGLSTVLAGIGLVVVGWAVVRNRVWRGWRRAVPLVLGCYVFMPMIPALGGTFLMARLAITGWMLLFALLGWVLAELATGLEADRA
jgi:hypothetical protein